MPASTRRPVGGHPCARVVSCYSSGEHAPAFGSTAGISQAGTEWALRESGLLYSHILPDLLSPCFSARPAMNKSLSKVIFPFSLTSTSVKIRVSWRLRQLLGHPKPISGFPIYCSFALISKLFLNFTIHSFLQHGAPIIKFRDESIFLI